MKSARKNAHASGKHARKHRKRRKCTSTKALPLQDPSPTTGALIRSERLHAYLCGEILLDGTPR